ncbi:MAG: MBL fold metallo-hydrolase [Candidatus Bathyarchaeia archaeon]
MELIILGSGGATTIPRPGCQCRVCVEARAKGAPYARSSTSMYVSEVNLLFDTPEEIGFQLNREGINDVDYIFYSHWHPDHTLGLRIVEKMYKFWLSRFVRGDKQAKKVKVCALTKVMTDLENKYGDFLDYYKRLGLTETVDLENASPFRIGNYRITPFEVSGSYVVSTVFLIEHGEKKAVYAPCDVKPFPQNLRLKKPDLLILGEVFPEGPLKDGITIPEGNPLRKELFSMEEALELIKCLEARKTIFTHIEEEWGKSYDDYKVIEKQHQQSNIIFAYDGMRANI